METEYLISEDEYVRANKLFSNLSRKQWTFYAVAIVCLLAVGLLAESKAFRFPAIFGLIGGITGHVIVRYLIAPWQTRELFRKYKAIDEPVKLIVEDNGLRFIGADNNSLLKWNHLMKWRENEEFILIYQNPKLYHLIPKRLGSAGIDITGMARKLEETIGIAT